MTREYLNPMEYDFKPQQLHRHITNEEAIRIVDVIISEVQTLDNLIYISGYKFANIISDLQNIKKDIPIKPKYDEYCPTCGRYIKRVGGLVDDCLYCGQKIDWRDK